MTAWLECSTLAEAEAVDAVAEVFGRIGQGVAIEEPVVSSPDGEVVHIASDRPVVVKTYLPVDERSADRQRQLEEAIWHLGRLRYVEPLQVRPLQEEDWADAWKRHFFVHRVGRRLVIVPSWRDYTPLAEDLCLQLDPGMAFGTGLHPTTRLCLQALESWLQPGESILDLGTGSGVLAIAAGLLGASQVTALDIEPVAVRVAIENVARNGQRDRVQVAEGSLPHPLVLPGAFDLIVANISFRVLAEVRSQLRQALRPGGRALLSGVLERDATALIQQYEQDGWRLVDRRSEGDWVLLNLASGAT
jgi:ribosomal protein L11 methyltransferase